LEEMCEMSEDDMATLLKYYASDEVPKYECLKAAEGELDAFYSILLLVEFEYRLHIRIQVLYITNNSYPNPTQKPNDPSKASNSPSAAFKHSYFGTSSEA